MTGKRSARRGARAGMTLIELLVSMCVLTAAFLMYSSAVISLSRQRAASHESAIAADAARQQIEVMRSESLASIWALYNADPSDDPAGAGTAPGNRFQVEGLRPLPGAANGLVGEIHMPGVEIDRGVWQMRETEQRPELGLPRDLNGDSIIDELDHSEDYVHLPVRVRVEWESRHGPRHFELSTMLVEYRR